MTTDSEAVTTVVITIQGETRSFDMSRERSILDAAKTQGIELPYSCRGGACAECRVKVLEGAVVMKRNRGLADWEVEQGFVLSCQARPTTERDVISCDEMPVEPE